MYRLVLDRFGRASDCRSVIRSVSLSTSSHSGSNEYDAVIVGGGHNGLVCAAYLAKAGLKPLVLERRDKLGGAAVTEELFDGFKFSRASYLLSLLRPIVVKDLQLQQHGLKVHLREPSSFTPLLDGHYLLLGSNEVQNQAEIGKFSQRDAVQYGRYEQWLSRMVAGIEPLLDASPPDLNLIAGTTRRSASWRDRWHMWTSSTVPLLKAFKGLGVEGGLQLYQLLTAPASRILQQHFESEPLLATLATDGVIGAFMGPATPGSGYVLLHHVMGELEGVKGAWGFVEGGMGAVSQTLAKVAVSHGAETRTNAEVAEILVEGVSGGGTVARGVRLTNGEVIKAKFVLSNATPKVTFLDLLPSGSLPPDFQRDIASISYASATTKINVALKQLPDFTCCPNLGPGIPQPHHQTTIHMGCSTLEELQGAYEHAAATGRPSEVPMIEMCLPSVLDPTIAPPGCHVASLFVQYTPYSYFTTSAGASEAEVQQRKEAFATKVFSIIDQYAPNFSSSVLFADVLTPPDLENVFGLTGGNIFHGAMSLDQLYFARPSTISPSHATPISGLYLCGSGAHPGGGVMGSAGRNAALTVLQKVAA